jgi:hypothetical protein
VRCENLEKEDWPWLDVIRCQLTITNDLKWKLTKGSSYHALRLPKICHSNALFGVYKGGKFTDNKLKCKSRSMSRKFVRFSCQNKFGVCKLNSAIFLDAPMTVGYWKIFILAGKILNEKRIPNLTYTRYRSIKVCCAAYSILPPPPGWRAHARTQSVDHSRTWRFVPKQIFR